MLPASPFPDTVSPLSGSGLQFYLNSHSFHQDLRISSGWDGAPGPELNEARQTRPCSLKLTVQCGWGRPGSGVPGGLCPTAFAPAQHHLSVSNSRLRDPLTWPSRCGHPGPTGPIAPVSSPRGRAPGRTQPALPALFPERVLEAPRAPSPSRFQAAPPSCLGGRAGARKSGARPSRMPALPIGRAA